MEPSSTHRNRDPVRRPWVVELHDALRWPRRRDLADRLATRWSELPSEAKSDLQMVGRHMVHCAYTMAAPYCSFGCSHCYLPAIANRVPIPPLDELRSQIDATLAAVGPGGSIQITGGDVVDAARRFNRRDDLVEAVAHATRVGLHPMVMTHGQGLLDEPELLDRLVVEGGLRRVGLHVDLTQNRRPGFPRRALTREGDLDPVRDELVDLLHGVRERTGHRVMAAMTVTVTPDNLDSIGDILRWLVADRRRLQTVATLSLLPEAVVGRTRTTDSGVTSDQVWEAAGLALGVRLATQGLLFGHPDCTRTTVVAVLGPQRRAVDLLGEPGSERDAAIGGLLRAIGGAKGLPQRRWTAAIRKGVAIASQPRVAVSALRWLRGRIDDAGMSGWQALWWAMTGQVGGLNLVIHAFMDADEVRAGGAVVEARLAGCAFRGAVRDGDGWRSVPMCEMNAGLRERLHREDLPVDRAAGG